MKTELMGFAIGLLVIWGIKSCVADGAEKTPMPQTVNEAAVLAVAEAYNHGSHWYEYGGVIVKTPQGYNPSHPITDGHADNVGIDEDNEAYDGDYPVVATYHTHPCLKGYIPGVFSPEDLKTTRASKNPGYVLDECTGDVHYWAPGDPTDAPKGTLNAMEIMMGAKIATGKIVGHIPVDGKKLEM